jgi:7-cyano-7-deazaguanine reductase
MKEIIDNTVISKHLGKSSEYKSSYDPSLLVREPRQSNRTHLDISDDNLPFVGHDTWNAYEISALTDNGLPVTGIGKICYSCASKYIVESKSIKLYLNSFNMTKMGSDASSVRHSIKNMIKKDLSILLETDVDVTVDEDAHVKNYTYTYMGGAIFNSHIYSTLEDEYNINGVEFTKYSESPDLLEVVDSVQSEVYYHSSLLKSNCRVTRQPDWGDIYIYIKKQGSTIDPISLLKYIVSFRDESHFHEEIAEAVYVRIKKALDPEELKVICLYARRGGIDLNPIRASHVHLLHKEPILDVEIPHIKTPKQ